jgi:hypothetical protein
MFDRFKSLFEKPMPREFIDPDLGSLKLDRGVWEGLVQRGGRDLSFHIAGTGIAPDSGLLVHVRCLLSRFSEAEHSAIEFLRSHESDLRQARLDFYAFDFLWEDKPDDFAFEFLANGDDSGVWRVEFVDGQPTHSGYDD